MFTKAPLWAGICRCWNCSLSFLILQGEKIIDVICLAQCPACGIIKGEPELLPSSMWGKASPSFPEKLLCVAGRPPWMGRGSDFVIITQAS